MKKQHWKVGCICTALCIFTAAIPAMPAFADDETATESTTEAATTEEAIGSGTCGENLTWRLMPEKNSQGLTEYTLYIDGTGDMEDYDAYDQSTTIDYRFVEMETTPWKNLDETIHKIIIADGVTSIGNFAFCGAILGGSDGIIVELPDSITRIGDYAFMNAGKGWGSRSTLKLSKFPKNLKTIGEGAFLSVTFEDSHLVLPDGLESIGAVAFSDCSDLDAKMSVLDDEEKQITKNIREMVVINSRTVQKQPEYTLEYQSYEREYEALKAKYQKLQAEKLDRINKTTVIQDFMEQIKKRKEPIKVFSSDVWLTAIETVTIGKKGELQFRFKNGTEITV